MRHRFHSICPYFAMFPESFVKARLTASPHDGVVFDPFCGRGTTVFQALLQGREAAGCDIHPVAVCLSGAKAIPPSAAQARERVQELEADFQEPDDPGWQGKIQEFFELCYHPETLTQVRYLRSALDWRNCRTDRFIAALCLGALHGESHRTLNCFSNRMPRTISTKPGYSIRWWRKNNHEPPCRDVFEILQRMIDYRFRTPPPENEGQVVEADARKAGEVLPSLTGRVTDVITSPPYLDTTNFREDQWLRLWFLGGRPGAAYDRRDDRHYCKEQYWNFVTESVEGWRELLAERARVVVRIGGRRFGKAELRDGLSRALAAGLDRAVALTSSGFSSTVKGTQASAFRGAKASSLVEHDFCFDV